MTVLKDLLLQHEAELEDITRSTLLGDSRRICGSLAKMLAKLGGATEGLACLTDRLVVDAFTTAADKVLIAELEAIRTEEERDLLGQQMAEKLEPLLGQLLLQLVSVQHDIKDELLEALGGRRDDLVEFREDLHHGLRAADVRLSELAVSEGGLGVRVSSSASKTVFVRRMTVQGRGSTGVDLR